MGGKEDIYREKINEVAEPLLIAAAGMSMDITLLDDFRNSTAFQWNGANPKEFEVLAWLPTLRYKLLHQEKNENPLVYRALLAFFRQWWTLIMAVLTAVVTGLVIMHLRSRGIVLK